VTTPTPDDILRFWFPERPETDHAAMARRMEWWFHGGADAQIMERFASLPEFAARGGLNAWATNAPSRLALILVLDQFSRTVYRGTARAYAQDPMARALSMVGIEIGHYAALEDPWQKTFFFLPLGHSENLRHLNLAVSLAEELARESSEGQRRMLEHSASQAHGHRNVVARFGRQPHRNEVLGRTSTPEELAYLARGELVHLREVPR